MLKFGTISVLAVATIAIILIAILRADLLSSPESHEHSPVHVDSSALSKRDNHLAVESKSHAPVERATNLSNGLAEIARDDLEALTAAAKAGDANAQFRLALAIRECIGLRSVTTGASSQDDSRFVESRRELQERRERCASLHGETKALQRQADEWEAQALSGGSTVAKAHKLISELNVEDQSSIERASMELRQLIPAREPYVYYGLAAIETAQAQTMTPKAIALRLLACEGSSAPAELCGAESVEIWQSCISNKMKCGDTVTLSDYYYNFYPHLFDSARGYLSEFKDKLRDDRYEEFESLLDSR